jgi:hypothetical protein
MPPLLTFVTVLFMALVAGVSFSHLLQRGPKADLPAPQFLAVQQILLRNYGAAVGALEAAGFVFAVALALVVQARPLLLALGTGAAACLGMMIAIWAVWINPINKTVNSWAPQSVPPNWTQFRDRWHALHTLRLGLALVGLSAVIVLALRLCGPS